MAKSIKYKEAETYHDAGNVYDNTQKKTQEAINIDLLEKVEKLRLKKMPFDVTTNEWSGFSITIPGQLIYIFATNYLLVQDTPQFTNNDVSFRVFGSLNNEKLIAAKNTKITGIAYYVEL